VVVRPFEKAIIVRANCVLASTEALNFLRVAFCRRASFGLFSRGMGSALRNRMTFNPSDGLAPLTSRIVGAAITVHRELGPGLLESAYQACLEYQLRENRVSFARQLALPLKYHGVYVDCGYRVDFLVEERVIVEVKSVDKLAPIHRAQLITYLKLTGCPVGLLLNFNAPSMRQGIRRIANRFLAAANWSPSEADGFDSRSDLPDLNE
jgi:GxxExxY protein